jgi:3'(2'), 5'-bisphosphate nucleotidase
MGTERLPPLPDYWEPPLSRLDTPTHADLLDTLTAISVRAALVILDEAGKGGVQRKADGSPVTTADLASEAAIREGLERLAPTLPIVSEEQATAPQPLAQDAAYFLVDPLDGTREFIGGYNEYAVNIALMEGGAPLLGVIAAPALGLVWRGIVGRGAERVAFAADGACAPPEPIHARSRPPDELSVLVSRSHLDPRTQAYLDSLPKARTVGCGSAVKFCRIADGSADLYPRLAPTHDWDIAAGHALVEAAGGRVLAPDGTPLAYGTAERLIPGFIASADPTKL